MTFYNPLPLQSPIDLGLALPITMAFPPWAMSIAWDGDMSGVILPNAHKDLEFVFKNPTGTMTVQLPGQAQATKFTLLKLHFHTKGEHLINGVASTLEIHIVHKTKEPDPFSHTGQTRDVYAVLGVMVEGGGPEGRSDEAIRKLIGRIKEAGLEDPTAANRSMPVEETLNPNHLAPFDPKTPLTDQPLWRYEGSLTSDRDNPNTGYVSWVVLQPKLRVTDGTINEWNKLRLIHEPRDPQALDRRFVFFNPGVASGGVGGGRLAEAKSVCAPAG
jgi:carbonic anhydrase